CRRNLVEAGGNTCHYYFLQIIRSVFSSPTACSTKGYLPFPGIPFLFQSDNSYVLFCNRKSSNVEFRLLLSSLQLGLSAAINMKDTDPRDPSEQHAAHSRASESDFTSAFDESDPVNTSFVIDA